MQAPVVTQLSAIDSRCSIAGNAFPASPRHGKIGVTLNAHEVMPMKTVGWIGLGTMGEPMARQLLAKGFPLIVYNRTANKADKLLELGAKRADSPGETARAADVVFTMLSDDRVVREAYFGEKGIWSGVRQGMTVIDCSTVSPELSRELYREAEARGVRFLDAPVTGSRPAAESGTLLFMIGGDAETVEAHRDLFEAMGRKIVHMGPAGTGSQTKLAHNTMVGIHMSAFAEALSMALKAGIPPQKFAEVVLNGAAASRQAELKAERMIRGDYSVQFGLGLMLKDLRLASRMAEQLGIRTPMLDLAREMFTSADELGWSDLDLSAVFKCYESWNGVSLSSGESEPAPRQEERRRYPRIPLNIPLKLSVYQWVQAGNLHGETIDGLLLDLSNAGMQISSDVKLEPDMFVVVHFPDGSSLPPLTARIIRAESRENRFHYGCLLSGLPLHTQKQLETYIASQLDYADAAAEKN
jgi:3-hydroxyisobutyrate dehydrogenase-like beta-hydroxyacid dehydrogenase